MSNRANELTLAAFNYFLSAYELETLGDSIARKRGLDVQDCRDRFERMYYDGCDETSLNAGVYGCYHDAAHDEWCAWDALEDLAKLTGVALDAPA